MAKKWLDSIEKQRRRIELKERYRQTNKQAGRRLDSAPVSAGRPKHVWSMWHTRRLMGDVFEK